MFPHNTAGTYYVSEKLMNSVSNSLSRFCSTFRVTLSEHLDTCNLPVKHETMSYVRCFFTTTQWEINSIILILVRHWGSACSSCASSDWLLQGSMHEAWIHLFLHSGQPELAHCVHHQCSGARRPYLGVHQRLKGKMDPYEPQLGCRISSVSGTTGAEPLLHACLRLHSWNSWVWPLLEANSHSWPSWAKLQTLLRTITCSSDRKALKENAMNLGTCGPKKWQGSQEFLVL